MASFFSFSAASTSAAASSTQNETPQLEITITPSASAFYAGETFRASITLRSVPRSESRGRQAGQGASSKAVTSKLPRASVDVPTTPTLPVVQRKRTGQIGLAIRPERENAEAGPSRITSPSNTYASPIEYSSRLISAARGPSRSELTGAEDSLATVGDELALSPRGSGIQNPKRYGGVGKGTGIKHDRRTQSLAVGKDVSPQEMIWALSGQPPPLPSRRTSGPTRIPAQHPHSRKISIASQSLIASPPDSTEELRSSMDDTYRDGHIDSSAPRHPVEGRISSASNPSSSASTSRLDLSGPPSSAGRISPLPNRQAVYHTTNSLEDLALPPPPSHPYSRSLAEPKEMSVLWAHTRLVAHFHPSNHYIPPDPLLPLRSLLLHQPIGSGSLAPSSPTGKGGSRWQLSFGTGTIGSEVKPSLTGSLVGLASSLVYGGQGGSLEEERKKVWNTKDLPVFETARSLLGIDLRLKEGDSREFSYSIPIPANLPPSHRGRAYRFEWNLVVSLAVAEVGGGSSRTSTPIQRTKEVEIPVRIWGNILLNLPTPMYNVLQPIIQIQDQGIVKEVQPKDSSSSIQSPDKAILDHSTKPHGRDTLASLESYAQQLRSASHTDNQPKASRAGEDGVPAGTALQILNGHQDAGRPRKGSFIQGDDELIDEDEPDGRCRQAVEILSRASPKASYDIAKDGTPVAVLTLIKSTYRLGETVLGVLTFNTDLSIPSSASSRQVLKVSTFLESYDTIPPPLLPLSARGGRSTQPQLARSHAESRFGYVMQTQRLSFSLDIPSDATPAFRFAADEPNAAQNPKDGSQSPVGNEEDAEAGQSGGVQWRIRLAFLVSAPTSTSQTPPSKRYGNHLFPSGKDKDNQFYTASTALAPSTPIMARTSLNESRTDAARTPTTPIGNFGSNKAEMDERIAGWEEMGVETVECEIPIRVLAGNTAFKVRSNTYLV